ncbi:AF1514 family protein [Desulfobulbus propionicus]|nr:AF1514 family protein [Desulfobulbus propionicus]
MTEVSQIDACTMQFVQVYSKGRRLGKQEERLSFKNESEGKMVVGVQRIALHIDGIDVDFSLAQRIGQEIAGKENEEAVLIAWSDARNNLHSPHGIQCEIRGEPGWEVYGRTHGGRLRISFNRDALVLIYS